MIASLRLNDFKNFVDERLGIGSFTIVVGANASGKSNVRTDVHMKERYFDRLARERETADGPGGGRGALGREAARRIDAIRQKCPEDFDDLPRRLQPLDQ